MNDYLQFWTFYIKRWADVLESLDQPHITPKEQLIAYYHHVKADFYREKERNCRIRAERHIKKYNDLRKIFNFRKELNTYR